MAKEEIICSIGDKDYLTKEELQAYLGISEYSFYKYRELGLERISIYGKHYYSKESIKRFMNKFIEM